jgi:hypothetical protein
MSKTKEIIGKNGYYPSRMIYIHYINENKKYRGIDEADSITYSQYLEIITVFIRVILCFIVVGINVRFPRFLGSIKLLKVKRKFTHAADGRPRLQVNWGASNVNKKKLIAEGKLPLLTKYYYNGKEVEEGFPNAEAVSNGGEPWLVYYTDPYFFKLRWAKSPIFKKPNFTNRLPYIHLKGYTFRAFRDFERAAVLFAKQQEDYHYENEWNNDKAHIEWGLQVFRHTGGRLASGRN